MSKRKKYILILLMSAVVVFVTVVVIYNVMQPTWLFQKLVLQPIPDSVRNIKAREKRTFLNAVYNCVLRFDISKSDLFLILASEPFQEISYVKYTDDVGILSYGKNRNSSGRDSKGVIWMLYDLDEGERAPEWFELGTWGSFKAYIVEEEKAGLYKARLLVYHESLGEAYFIQYELRATWGGRMSVTEEK